MFFVSSTSETRKYKIKVKDGMDWRFKDAIKSFDENVKIKSDGTFYIVVTSVEKEEIQNFTSVKSISQITEN